LSDTLFDNEILPAGYSIYRKDREARGGGIMLAVKSSIPSSIVSLPPDIEALTVNIETNDPTTFCVVYNPLNSVEEYMLSVFNYIHSVASLCNNKLIISGDFNFPTIN